MIGESVDVALRMGEPADSDMIYRKIGMIEHRGKALRAGNLEENPQAIEIGRLVGFHAFPEQ